jgi:ABC-type polysaccharide/polyol phosphate transport system ATPase subunit
MTATIAAEGVGVRFFFDRQQRVTAPLAARLRRHGEAAWGIRDVTAEIGSGEAVALLGHSGSGKTTLLRTVAGVLRPDAGRIEVGGRVASLLSVNAGLMPALTGRENALLLGVLGGLTRREATASLKRIQEWSGLENEFEHPASSYSQGMRARLGFSVSVQLSPSILLLDEVHEALDHDFRERVVEKARSIVQAGGIVIAAGHDHDLLERLCSRALLLERGHLVADGDFMQVQSTYLSAESS